MKIHKHFHTAIIVVIGFCTNATAQTEQRFISQESSTSTNLLITHLGIDSISFVLESFNSENQETARLTGFAERSETGVYFYKETCLLSIAFEEGDKLLLHTLKCQVKSSVTFPVEVKMKLE